jgi:diguanylate cyclase (GGDEF)-like protein
MHALITDIRRRAALWRLEHTQVALSAQRINLQRAGLIAPLIAVFNLVFVIWLGLELWLQQDSEIVTQWKLGLFLTHLLMGLSFALLGWLARQVGDAVNSLWARSLPVLMAALALSFVIGFCTFDQWITPNMTPFVIGAMSIGLVVHLRPTTAGWLFVLAYALFYVAIGSTQVNAQQLLSNRINGFAAAGLGWALSLILWRKFTTIVLQQLQLENANAELQLKQRELQRMTRLDGLTGLYNRSTFVDLARQELARAQRQSSSTTILLLDLDFFKLVNDTWGHPAGDAVLKNVAVVANSTVRVTDLVGRLGGEEFIILLPNTSLEAARRLAEKLRRNLEHSHVAWEKAVIRTTVSIGVASTSAAEKLDFDHLYSAADKALYIAKEKGRNRVI